MSKTNLLGDLVAKLDARPPFIRSIIWLAATAALATFAVIAFADLGALAQHNQTLWAWLKFVGIGTTGIVAIVAAFHLGEANRSRAWTWLPLVPLVVWIGSCLMDGRARSVRSAKEAWTVSHSLDGVLFILTVSIPLAVSILALLSRNSRSWSAWVAPIAGLGVAAIAVFILQFFHAYAPNMIDFIARIAAIIVVVGGVTFSSQLLPAYKG